MAGVGRVPRLYVVINCQFFVVKGVEIPVHKRFFSEQTRYLPAAEGPAAPGEQREAAHAAHPLRTSLPFLCLSGVVLAGALTAASCTLCYQVEAQGQTLAFFQDPGTYDQAVAQAEDRASQILEAPVS